MLDSVIISKPAITDIEAVQPTLSGVEAGQDSLAAVDLRHAGMTDITLVP